MEKIIEFVKNLFKKKGQQKWIFPNGSMEINPDYMSEREVFEKSIESLNKQLDKKETFMTKEMVRKALDDMRKDL